MGRILPDDFLSDGTKPQVLKLPGQSFPTGITSDVISARQSLVKVTSPHDRQAAAGLADLCCMGIQCVGAAFSEGVAISGGPELRCAPPGEHRGRRQEDLTMMVDVCHGE